MQLGRSRQVSVATVSQVQVDVGGVGCNAPSHFQKVREAKNIGQVDAIVPARADDPVLHLKGHDAAFDLSGGGDGQAAICASSVGGHGLTVAN